MEPELKQTDLQGSLSSSMYITKSEGESNDSSLDNIDLKSSILLAKSQEELTLEGDCEGEYCKLDMSKFDGLQFNSDYELPNMKSTNKEQIDLKSSTFSELAKEKSNYELPDTSSSDKKETDKKENNKIDENLSFKLPGGVVKINIQGESEIDQNDNVNLLKQNINNTFQSFQEKVDSQMKCELERIIEKEFQTALQEEFFVEMITAMSKVHPDLIENSRRIIKEQLASVIMPDFGDINLVTDEKELRRIDMWTTIMNNKFEQLMNDYLSQQKTKNEKDVVDDELNTTNDEKEEGEILSDSSPATSGNIVNSGFVKRIHNGKTIDKQFECGELYITFGSMKSGKSTAAISYANRMTIVGLKTCYVGYGGDTRTGSKIKSHHDTGGVILLDNIDVIKSETIADIYSKLLKYTVIVIDEAQFFKDITLVEDLILKANKLVHISALDGDANLKSFGKVHELIHLCDAGNITKVFAFCVDCAAIDHRSVKAGFTFCLEEVISGVNKIGAKEYIPVCLKHHQFRTRERDKLIKKVSSW